jgi:hypothetical protein
MEMEYAVGHTARLDLFESGTVSRGEIAKEVNSHENG